MKVTISIKEGYTAVFLNFLKTLSYVKVEEEQALDIPEHHKMIVRERIKNTKPDELLDWDVVQKKSELIEAFL